MANSLSHKTEIYPTKEQQDYLFRAFGTARRVWNWALAEWNRQYDAGEKPNALALKKKLNSIKYTDPNWLDKDGNPWIKTIHRDAHSQPFTNLGKAWKRFFDDLREGKDAHRPVFKKKHKARKSCYFANGLFNITGKTVRLPKIKDVRMAEEVRFSGKMMNATVSYEGGKWFISFSMEVSDEDYYRTRTGNGVEASDLGFKDFMVTSTGRKVQAPKPLKRNRRRLKIRNRSMARKVKAARIKRGDDMSKPMPKGKKLERGSNFHKSARALARIHKRCANIRTDFAHKLSTQLCRENQTLVIETLNVKGMAQLKSLARSIGDIALGTFVRLLEYKSKRYRCNLIKAGRWFPSSKLCSSCGFKNTELKLSDREWTCPSCGVHHDRDINAAINLKGLATSKTALPMASSSSNGDAENGVLPVSDGKVTSSSYEPAHLECSGEKSNCVPKCTPL